MLVYVTQSGLIKLVWKICKFIHCQSDEFKDAPAFLQRIFLLPPQLATFHFCTNEEAETSASVSQLTGLLGWH